MIEHRPGPLVVEYDEYAGYDCMTAGFVVREKGAVGRLAVFDCADGNEWAKVNAEHLVACWNACEGVNPEAVPELLEAARLKRNTALRDPENFVGEWVAIPAEDFDRLRAAVAKAEGEEAK